MSTQHLLKRAVRSQYKYAAPSSALGDRQIRVIASNGSVDLVGDVLEPTGCDLSVYRANPIVLADHDPTKPIGTAVVSIRNGAVEALITFAPAGVSVKADEYAALAKAGVLAGVSVGFSSIETQPLRGGGLHYVKWRLMEISLVSVPCNSEALVLERSLRKMLRKSGRVLSQANQEHLDELVKCLSKMAKSHEKMALHLAGATRHAQAIAANAAGADPDDDADDHQPGDDEENADEELAAQIARNKRIVQVLELTEPPLSLEEKERARRIRVAEALRIASNFV